MKKIFLAGYQNISLEEFIVRVKNKGVTMLVDVREIPLSRKRGFSKNQFKRVLMENGIKYYHIKELGSPTPIRHELRETGNYINFFRKYRAYVRGKHFEIQKVVDLANVEVVCIMCFEENCELCHRTIVADEIQKVHPKLTIQAI